MSDVREAIRNANRLARMRMGQAAFDFIELPSLKTATGDQIRLAQVPLTEAEAQQGVWAAARVEGVEENMAGLSLRNRIAQQHDVWQSLRLPDDVSKLAFESVDELIETVEPEDIDMAINNLSLIMDYSSPTVDGLTEEALEDLKKAFAATGWSGLSGSRWAAVKLCCQVLLPELLQAKLSGSGSTDSSTERSEDEESTSPVLAS